MAGNQTDARRRAEGHTRDAQRLYDMLKSNHQATDRQRNEAMAALNAAKAAESTARAVERDALRGCAPTI